MAENTKIEWTDVTDNIIVAKDGGWWCHKISPGCTNCYAARLNQNGFYGGNHLSYGGDAPSLVLREDVIDRWPRQTKPRRHFVASMTDVFGEWVPREWVFKYLDGMKAASRQTFQVLTKRAGVMRREVKAWLEVRELNAVPANIWLGVSVEDQERALERVFELAQIPATRFLSIEPLLGAVDLTPFLLCKLHWVIVGGESGPRARPLHPDWVRSLRNQCTEAGIAFFFKQWGEWAPFDGRRGVVVRQITTHNGPSLGDGLVSDTTVVMHVGKKVAGRILDGRTWNDFPI